MGLDWAGAPTRNSHSIATHTRSTFTLARHSHSQERQLAIRKFNEKAKAGIAYLLERRVVPRTPDAVAEFLQGTKGLSKRRIGDYLGEPSDFNTAVLRAYTGLFNFSSMHFVEVRRARRARRARRVLAVCSRDGVIG